MSDEIIRVDTVETGTLRVGGQAVLGGEVVSIEILPADPTQSQISEAIRYLQNLMIEKGLAIHTAG